MILHYFKQNSSQTCWAFSSEFCRDGLSSPSERRGEPSREAFTLLLGRVGLPSGVNVGWKASELEKNWGKEDHIWEMFRLFELVLGGTFQTDSSGHI